MRGRYPATYTLIVPSPLRVVLATYFPVSRHLGVRVREATSRRVVLEAPLAPNRNRVGTAFAGSLNALATLAGWSWLTLYLRETTTDLEVVLQDSSISYHRPATSAFRAVCLAPGAGDLDRFSATLSRRGRARLRLTVTLTTADGPMATFTGRYVATR